MAWREKTKTTTVVGTLVVVPSVMPNEANNLSAIILVRWLGCIVDLRHRVRKSRRPSCS
jgi:hypothetical protein